jgi:hypothetical protein
MNGAYIRMAEGRGRAGLMEQILSCGIRRDGALAKNFQGYVAMQEFVTGAVDNAHPSFADFGVNTIVTENLTDHRYAPGVWSCGLSVYRVNGFSIALAGTDGKCTASAWRAGGLQHAGKNIEAAVPAPVVIVAIFGAAEGGMR